ncbi:hypothetical protein TrLO_g11437 [Triparma laevis f. longispina]|nr:hypothetical protein TrLO_g11437 [Triparma laevis f. longispina]
MTIPESLQKFGKFVLDNCSKLVPSNINVSYDRDEDDDAGYDATPDVVAHLRSKQQAEAEQAEADRIKQEADRIKQDKNDARSRRLQQRQARRSSK